MINKNENIGKKKNSRHRHTIGLTVFLIFYLLGMKFYALKYKNDPNRYNSKKTNGRKHFNKPNISEKKELAAPPYHRINRFFDFLTNKE